MAKYQETRRIVQIIPATGWWARHDGSTDPERGGMREGFMRLVCWALVENEEGKTEVVGMDGDGDLEVGFADYSSLVEYHYSPDHDPNHQPPANA